MMSGNSRRTFLRLGLTAASAPLIYPAARAVGADDAKPRRSTPTKEIVYLVVYRPGEKWLTGQPLEAQPLREHGRYMLSLHSEGILRHAGRFADGSGGAAVFAAPDDATATGIVEQDPAVVSKVFAYDLRRWVWVDWERLRPATDG